MNAVLLVLEGLAKEILALKDRVAELEADVEVLNDVTDDIVDACVFFDDAEIIDGEDEDEDEESENTSVLKALEQLLAG